MRRDGWPVTIAALLVGLTSGGEARGADVYANLKVPAQVREGYQSHDTEAPVLLYSDLGIGNLGHGMNAETYWRVDGDLANSDSDADFYSGVLRAPGVIPYVSDLSLGRQFLSEGPRGGFVADAGRATVDFGGPVALSVFGGEPRYFERTTSDADISHDEQMFGARVNVMRLSRGYINAGFLQHLRDGDTLSQLVTLNAGRNYPSLPGMPKFYGSLSYDAEQQQVNRGQLGTQAVLLQPRLLGNFEFTYYKPDKHSERLMRNADRREDTIFDVISSSDQLQAAGTLHYILTPSLSTFANLGYQRYDNSDGVHTDGYVGGAGVHWLPEGDGLESVRLEYYVADSRGGTLNGGRLYYDNRVYDRIHFRTKVDVAYYEKITNENDVAVATLLGIGYDVLPGLYCETYLEGNHNERFDADMRLGLYFVYDWFKRTTQQSAPATSGADA